MVGAQAQPFGVLVAAPRIKPHFAEEALMRTRKKIRAMGGQDFDDVAIDVIGEESFWGSHASAPSSREVL